jgi:hypothetical protein
MTKHGFWGISKAASLMDTQFYPTTMLWRHPPRQLKETHIYYDSRSEIRGHQIFMLAGRAF